MKKGNVKKNPKKQQFKFGILPKLLLGILIPLFVVLGIMGVFLASKGSKTINETMNAELESETRAAASEVSSLFEKYYGISDCLASTQIIRDITTEDVEGGISKHQLFPSLLETIQLVQKDNQEDIQFVWVANFSTGELLQSDGQMFNPSNMDITSRVWYDAVMQKKDTIATSAYKNINTDNAIVTIASPIFVDNQIKGIVGMDINIQNLIQILSKISIGKSGYITLYDSENRILYHPDNSLIDTYAEDANYSENMLTAITNKENSNAMAYTRSGTNYYGSTTNIDLIGYTILGVMPEAEFTAPINNIVNILVVGVVACGILLTVICVFIALSITKPLKRLNNTVGILADGNLDVIVDMDGRDEVSEVGENVKRIVERLKEYILYINEISDILYQIGKGNLVFDLKQEYVGEFSKVKDALLNIRRTLTETLTNISQSAKQVNAGAEQIASGAQSLAQGATEQASSVQELAASIQDLSLQATDEANKAVEAGVFLQEIKDEVEKSNHQMELMREAMNNISVQSNTIRSIIKTINDIAFQTNILALNAAVEAARAGSAGKGFSVVADEVRNLAGKSAEAAKRTNELIENSVQAVKNGEEITQITADSLMVVSTETNKIVNTINEIANTYHNQAGKLSEISRGIDQISNVVQTNSATAEQSAAASEELSSQAYAMTEQVKHFKMDKDF